MTVVVMVVGAMVAKEVVTSEAKEVVERVDRVMTTSERMTEVHRATSRGCIRFWLRGCERRWLATTTLLID